MARRVLVGGPGVGRLDVPQLGRRRTRRRRSDPYDNDDRAGRFRFMAIARYRGRPASPWREFDTLTHRLGQLFDESVGGEAPGTSGWMPAVDVEETTEAVTLTAELPGMTQDDVEIELENNVLTIRGEKITNRGEGSEERRYHLWERRAGSFQRSFTLPRTVNAEDISAEFSEGVLRVVMPKSPEAKGRRIRIDGKKK